MDLFKKALNRDINFHQSKGTSPTQRFCISNNVTFYIIPIKGLIMDREETIYYKLQKQSLGSKKNNKELKK